MGICNAVHGGSREGVFCCFAGSGCGFCMFALLSVVILFGGIDRFVF